MSAILHQGLFTVIAFVAIAELSLTGVLLSKGLDAHEPERQRLHDLYVVCS
jgi:hypothetical protein